MGKIESRKKEIVDLLVSQESMSVADLVQSLSVSEVTVRRTVRTMEKEGKIIRTHGGVKLYRKTIDYFFDKKFLLNVEKKKKIGERASELVGPNEVLLLDSGTTVLHLAQAIAYKIEGGRLAGLSVITNSLAVAEVLGDLCKVVLLGGQVRLFRRDVTGLVLEKNIRMFRAHKAFIGTDGVTAKDGLMTTDELTSKVDEEMIRRSEQVILLADSSKFDNPSFVSYAGLKDIDVIISDEGLKPEQRREYESAGVRLFVV
jgi:DeoR/GlpR family transcriptional regulator of sugar metabolism